VPFIRHGEMVWEEYKKLINAKFVGTFLENYADRLIELQYSDDIIREYTTYHDIGKPVALVIGEDGKKHYPDHSNISANLYTEHNKDNPNCEIISNLIRNDMLFHVNTGYEILQQVNNPNDLATLLCASLAELYANKPMFGEESFKIKYKKLAKKAKLILGYLFEHPYLYILIRKDLPLPQIAVQSCHAAIESAKKYHTEHHPSVIICTVKNENDLINQQRYLTNNGIQFMEFREPDRNNELTAICSEPIYGDDRKIFSKFQLFKGELK